MEMIMKRSLLAMMLACLVAGATLLPQAAEARHRRSAGAFVGGFAAGALLGGMLMAPGYAYPHPYYGPVYYGYAPAPRCFRRFESVWNGYRWYRQRVLICY
jgi:hypothetical protein